MERTEAIKQKPEQSTYRQRNSNHRLQWDY